MYIHDRGYVVRKSAISPTELHALKKTLTLSPKVPQMYGKSAKICLYRENDEKIYLPSAFGIARYGLPKVLIKKGDAICIPFVKPIREYQTKIVNVFLDHVRDKTMAGGILEVPCGRGKCLARNTAVMMYSGQNKKVQDIVVGDILMGDDSLPRKVLSTCQGREKMYRVQNARRPEQFYIVNESHILSLQDTNGVVHDLPVNLPTKLKGYRVPVDYAPSAPLPISPHFLGYWLGDPEMRTQCLKYASPNSNHVLSHVFSALTHPMLSSDLPDIYKFSSREDRMQLLAGFLRTCKYLNRGYKWSAPHSARLVEDMISLSRSLGFACHSAYQPKTFTSIFLLYGDRKRQYRIAILPLPVDDYFGFEIDGNRRFLLGDFTVTHNTVMALNICSQLERKTLILVHKEFLMNQWIDRIQEFIPSAKVGIVQGKIFDIDHKDIVIGMIQTLYDKQFPSGTFSSFGLTIIDEVHRIGSEEFSKTLFQIVTPYMLGISATVDRKDGLTEILYHFIGPKIYSEERSSEEVEVRAIEFQSDDSEFNTVLLDQRENVRYSSMINKISDFGPRRDFLVKVLRDLIEEHPENQIMVLSHKRDLLAFLHTQIDFATRGYYVGKMTRADLLSTETDQIVLATYSMAAEALDIKTLNTLVMVSPKTDIVQSVGRILRTSSAGKIIVDIVDAHAVFQNQWKKRKAFYKKNEYTIRYIKSTDYIDMEHNWKIYPKEKRKCLLEL